ncbi:MAG: dihydrolipoyl dehydrogenase [Alphaproteobacteria bacterium]|nr:dihydrolipoyl dehydrogenase [Alphaproteobacteria bacterium]OJV46349.1 MAG: dihydrolipoyl dehydrogenase [Alphaproteobacteria bacterium 43-37]
MQQFDVIVIGGGPGGYAAAIKAAQLGLKVVCIEKRKTLGGTCLNVGCIPSKALLESSEKFSEAQHELAAHGIQVTGVKLDLKTMLDRKDKLVSDLTGGIDFLFKKYKVTRAFGHGAFTGPQTVTVKADDGSTQAFGAPNIIIATGSTVAELPGVEIDEEKIVSSTGALALKQVPKHLVVIGGGYIGLEMGTVWQRLGAKVTVVEFMDKIVPAMDREVGQALQKVLIKQGIEFKLGTKVSSVKKTKTSVDLELQPAQGGKSETLSCDVVLVAIGRKPNTQGLGLEAVGLKTDDRGRVDIDNHFQTSVPGVFAIGDVVRGAMLAHKAEEEGIAVAEIIAGQAGHVNYDAIPAVVYTWPEVATVGKTQEELDAAGIAYKVGKFPFMANGRAKAMGSADGFVKILACVESDRVMGVHIIGPQAGTMIAEAAVAMEFGASSEDIARTCHAHPTLNEAVKEAAMAVTGAPIHF